MPKLVRLFVQCSMGLYPPEIYRSPIYFDSRPCKSFALVYALPNCKEFLILFYQARHPLKQPGPEGCCRFGPCFERISSSLQRVVNLSSATDRDPSKRFAGLGIYGINVIRCQRCIEFIGDIVL